MVYCEPCIAPNWWQCRCQHFTAPPEIEYRARKRAPRLAWEQVDAPTGTLVPRSALEPPPAYAVPPPRWRRRTPYPFAPPPCAIAVTFLEIRRIHELMKQRRAPCSSKVPLTSLRTMPRAAPPRREIIIASDQPWWRNAARSMRASRAMRASPFYLILLSLLRRVLSNRRNAGGAGQDWFLELFIRERSSKPF